MGQVRQQQLGVKLILVWNVIVTLGIELSQCYLHENLYNPYVNVQSVNIKNLPQKKKIFVNFQKYFVNIKQMCKYTNKFHT